MKIFTKHIQKGVFFALGYATGKFVTKKYMNNTSENNVQEPVQLTIDSEEESSSKEPVTVIDDIEDENEKTNENTESNESEPIKCPECGKPCKNKHGLKIHKGRQHSEE